jgi:hypothetical protein
MVENTTYMYGQPSLPISLVVKLRPSNNSQASDVRMIRSNPYAERPGRKATGNPVTITCPYTSAGLRVACSAFENVLDNGYGI